MQAKKPLKNKAGTTKENAGGICLRHTGKDTAIPDSNLK
jgi:hypothetical protein